MSFWDKVKDFLRDEPIYADRPSDNIYVEGWKIAYQQEKAKRELAECRLNLLDLLADGIIDYDRCPQYGRDIKFILTATEEQLREDYIKD